MDTIPLSPLNRSFVSSKSTASNVEYVNEESRDIRSRGGQFIKVIPSAESSDDVTALSSSNGSYDNLSMNTSSSLSTAEGVRGWPKMSSILFNQPRRIEDRTDVNDDSCSTKVTKGI